MGILHSILNHIDGWLHPSGPENEFIDAIVDIIEPKLKFARGYRNRLREPLEICRKHCHEMVSGIPGPIKLNRNGQSNDPLIRAAFPKSELLVALLNQANNLVSSTQLSGTDRVALLTMTSREKTIFGRKQVGNMSIGDAAMRAVTFTDHAIVGLSDSLTNSKEALETHALDIIAEAAARHLSEIRTRVVDLNERQERLRAIEKMFGSATGASMGSVFVPFDPERTKKHEEVERLLAETEDELASARSRSETPNDWLTIVHDYLSQPEDILNMRLSSLRLNWLNVLTDDPSEQADTITVATFTIADEMQREGVLLSYELN